MVPLHWRYQNLTVQSYITWYKQANPDKSKHERKVTLHAEEVVEGLPLCTGFDDRQRAGLYLAVYAISCFHRSLGQIESCGLRTRVGSCREKEHF